MTTNSRARCAKRGKKISKGRLRGAQLGVGGILSFTQQTQVAVIVWGLWGDCARGVADVRGHRTVMMSS